MTAFHDPAAKPMSRRAATASVRLRHEAGLHARPAVKLTKLAKKVERARVPVEGWLHFHVKGVRHNEIGATVYRLSVLTPTGAINADIKGEKTLASTEGQEFQKIADHAKGFIYH